MNTENKDTEQSKYNKFQGILSDAAQIEPNGNQGSACFVRTILSSSNKWRKLICKLSYCSKNYYAAYIACYLKVNLTVF